MSNHAKEKAPGSPVKARPGRPKKIVDKPKDAEAEAAEYVS